MVTNAIITAPLLPCFSLSIPKCFFFSFFLSFNFCQYKKILPKIQINIMLKAKRKSVWGKNLFYRISFLGTDISLRSIFLNFVSYRSRKTSPNPIRSSVPFNNQQLRADPVSSMNASSPRYQIIWKQISYNFTCKY